MCVLYTVFVHKISSHGIGGRYIYPTFQKYPDVLENKSPRNITLKERFIQKNFHSKHADSVVTNDETVIEITFMRINVKVS